MRLGRGRVPPDVKERLRALTETRNVDLPEFYRLRAVEKLDIHDTIELVNRMMWALALCAIKKTSPDVYSSPNYYRSSTDLPPRSEVPPSYDDLPLMEQVVRLIASLPEHLQPIVSVMALVSYSSPHGSAVGGGIHDRVPPEQMPVLPARVSVTRPGITQLTPGLRVALPYTPPPGAQHKLPGIPREQAVIGYLHAVREDVVAGHVNVNLNLFRPNDDSDGRPLLGDIARQYRAAANALGWRIDWQPAVRGTTLRDRGRDIRCAVLKGILVQAPGSMPRLGLLADRHERVRMREIIQALGE